MPYSMLTRRNGKPLSATDAQKIREDMRKAEAERKTYHVGRIGLGFVSPQFGSLAHLARLMENTIVREELLNGRKTIILKKHLKRLKAPTRVTPRFSPTGRPFGSMPKTIPSRVGRLRQPEPSRVWVRPERLP
jgi:hypothetical protein